MPRPTVDADRRLGNRIRLRDLQILIHVVELGSMAKAASYLSISQPSVSQAIADLEHAIGARLLDRSPQGVAPTIYGEIFLKRGLEAFDALRQGLRDVERVATPNAGDIWIGSAETWLIGFIPSVIQRLSQRHPSVAIHALEANASDFDFHKLRERRLDLMIGRVERTSIDDDLSVEVLYEEPVHVVVGAHSPLAQRRKVKLADLANERWMMSEPSNLMASLVSRAFHAGGLEFPRPSVFTTSMCVYLPLLASTDYVTVLASSVLRYCAERWPLKVLPIDLGITSPVGLFTLRNRTLGSVVELFIEEARFEALRLTANEETWPIRRGPVIEKSRRNSGVLKRQHK
jgi:DNA-binding transcriptional LysR family regulator